MKKLLFLPFLILFVVAFASAASTCLTINSKTTSAYLNELPSINAQLSSCAISVPQQASSLLKDGNVLVSIKMNSGITEQFYVTIASQKLSSFTRGKPASFTHEARLSEVTFDKILNSNDATNEILSGIKSKKITIIPTGVVNKMKWFFAKLFLPKPSSSLTTPTGKPKDCDETYLPGHRDYVANKALWDSYSADTDKVCQSIYGKGQPSPCVHGVQLSLEGNPYYLCWYKE